MRDGRAGILSGPVPALLVLVLALLLEPSRPAATGGFATPLEQRLQDLETETARDAAALEALKTFYAARDHRPFWLDGGRPNRRAHALAIELRSAERHGLRPQAYLKPLRKVAAADLAAVDIALSRTLIRYATDVAIGRVDPRVVDAEIEVAPAAFDPLGLLEKIAGGTPVASAVGRLGSAHPGYERLREALLRVRTGAAGRTWPRLPPGGTLELGARGPEVLTLRHLLELTGDLGRDAPADDPEAFDRVLEGAVAAFQQRHGLAPDGRVGARTRAALARTPDQRIDQITLNLERLRWLNGDLGERHIFVNLADFNLRMVERGVPIFQTRVVVGAPYHRTPVFTGQMTYIEINPYWHVPPSIARDEILPAVALDPTWLIAHDMEVLDDWSHEARLLDPSTVDWRAIPPDQLRFKFRQKPGPRNALGRIKFMLPNQFNVYLHDTPARALFSRTVRSFSHGCIRVEEPETLASILLRDQAAWTRPEIERAIADGGRQVVRLTRPIPVHLTYLTSWVDDAGRLHFRDDIYGRDDRLRLALAEAS